MDDLAIEALAKDKVAIVVDDNPDGAESKAMLLQIGGIDARPITTVAQLPSLVSQIHQEGKEVFMVMTDNNLGPGMSGEKLWMNIKNNQIPGLDPNTIVEIHSGGEVDDPENYRFSNTSSQNRLQPMLNRMGKYLRMQQGKQAPSKTESVTEEDRKSFVEQLEFARLASQDPYQAYKNRTGRELPDVDYYIGDRTTNNRLARERGEWKQRFAMLAQKAEKYGLKINPDGNSPAEPLQR